MRCNGMGISPSSGTCSLETSPREFHAISFKNAYLTENAMVTWTRAIKTTQNFPLNVLRNSFPDIWPCVRKHMRPGLRNGRTFRRHLMSCAQPPQRAIFGHR